MTDRRGFLYLRLSARIARFRGDTADATIAGFELAFPGTDFGPATLGGNTQTTPPRPQDNPVQIQVTARHGHLSEETNDRLKAKVEKLTRHFDRLTSIEVVVDLQDASKPKVDLLVSAEHKHDFVPCS